MTARISHKQREARRINAYNNTVNYILNATRTVKVNDLYELIGNAVYSSSQYFVRNFIDMAANDSRIVFHTAKKKGTFAVAAGSEMVIPENPNKPVTKGGKRGRKPSPRHIQMGGLFGMPVIDLTGSVAEIEVSEEVWIRCKSTPKMISNVYNDTVEVFRKDLNKQTSEYLQVTSKGRQFHFVAA